jgi:polyhydroxybutyrate depolymerase
VGLKVALATSAVALTCACGGATTAPSTPTRSVVVNGVSRTYTLHLPSTFQRNSGALVIALHGAGGNGSSFESQTGFSETADRYGFAVVYPDGLLNPRAGFTDWQHYGSDFADDIGFLRQLIAAASGELQPDGRRIFVTGFSDGGRLAHRAGVELSDQIAAIAVVGGSLFDSGPAPPIPPVRAAASVLILQGDADAYCGTTTDASQDQTFDYWVGAAADSCSQTSTPLPLCDAQGLPTTVLDKSGSSCRSGVEVRLYRIIGGGHAWFPTLYNVSGQGPFNPNLPGAVGTTTNELVWSFLAAHPKR